MTEAECIALKQQAFRKYFHSLNEQQQQAVFSVNGPVLVLAGAGSGKTTAIISRIVNMIYFGDGYAQADGYLPEEDAVWLQAYIDGKEPEDVERLREILAIAPIRPWNILAITFTNKAAGEMRARLASTMGEELASSVHASTFHSACVQILRRSIERLGYGSDFAIYDADDSRKLMKSCLADCNVSEKQFPPRGIVQEISNAKDAMISPEEMWEDAGEDYRKQTVARLYAAYQRHLRESNALDFDDIIYLTVELFRRFPEELAKYQYRFPYVLVDEYQDTNHAQYQLISLLTHASGNLCVVGDDDQSIYRFRGATIENILGFEEEFPDCTVIRLEQNYRSTQNILDAANSVIANNTGRKSKHLWTNAGAGEKITWYRAADESDESAYVSDTILKQVKAGEKYSDHAILYRMNAQSNMLERALVHKGIPYRIYGGTRFYDRKEIKDILAYMSIVENPNDRVRFERIVNEPKRGIGNATLALLLQISQDLHLSPLEVLQNVEQYPALSKKKTALKKFAELWEALITAEREQPLEQFLDTILEKTGYHGMLESMGEEGTFRLENIEELKTSILTYQNEAEEASLGGFLEEISLYTDVDKYEPDQDTVMLMTVHSAKGLEFRNVFLVGMEQGVFPGNRSLSTPQDLEEERRLAYVALTRAKEKLTLTTAASRMLFGMTMRNPPSQFLEEIDKSLLEEKTSRRQSKRGIPAGNAESVQSISLLQQQMAASKKRVYQAQPKEFHVGERVRHAVFGDGTVLSITKMANDAMLEVGFDQVGTKRLMASHPKIKKLEE
ncbi:ATP-dependent helicase [Ruminococcus callidus]|jgi:DNA helicase-2/ATP-dependent DNA helicase PcrA|uniref:ATP-dependent helicase n=2 Tax=Ruminococcus callidus TaxID=40519 RepID=UPI000EE729B6|nr:UvrD-helicase domain-containing protein [Ruminococcus callidus]HCD40522.1 ATP-dependent DNA helicase PcrA [Ruminococcus sp.]HCY34945.1 ATP-dependent DNA helicase PcrA [Ruminococcus sp.]